MAKRWGMVIDVNRCVGCRSCVVACKHENTVGPKQWWNRVVKAGPKGSFPDVEMYYFPLMCMHCEKAPCIDACPNQAIYKQDGGIVLISEEKCIACEPCKIACPAGLSPRSYISLLAEGRFREAIDVVRETIPFPGICGRVCKHPCENECRRSQVDDPVAIAALKRFLADWEVKNGGPEIRHVARTRKEEVAVIGSGPAGLTAAHDLVKLGYGVTVFEALPVVGGLMRVGIPFYRLPKEVVDREIGALLGLGMELKTNTRVGTDITLAQLRENYKAIFVATGAHRALRLGIEGEELKGVMTALDLLREVNLELSPTIEERVVVIGGGDMAMDVACAALRLGAKEVHVVCLESRQEMPASEKEKRDVLDEGIILHPSLGPKRILGRNGGVTGVETIAVKSVFDGEGRFNPTFIPGTESIIDADNIVLAIGQAPDLSFLGNEIRVTQQGALATDSETLATSEEGIFAGGDAEGIGPKDVVQAIGAGHKAAMGIDYYLRGEKLPPKPPAGVLSKPVDVERVDKEPRQPMPSLPVPERLKGFAETELGLTQDMAMAEARRCLVCSACMEACPYGAMLFDPLENGVEKCTFCVSRIQEGEDPVCVRTCIGRALRFGDLADPTSEVSKLLREKQSVTLLPETGTEPAVHYIYPQVIEFKGGGKS